MNYARIIPMVDYTSKAIARVLGRYKYCSHNVVRYVDGAVYLAGLIAGSLFGGGFLGASFFVPVFLLQLF